jgi:octaprenyl-diphosphate synthase
LEALASFGLNLGIAFQLVDDLFDLIAQPQKLGKPVGNDIKEGNITLPLIHLLKQADLTEKERIKQIFQSANGRPVDMSYIKTLLEKYESNQYVLGLAAKYIQRAKEDLNLFDDSAFSKALSTLADYVIDRDF